MNYIDKGQDPKAELETAVFLNLSGQIDALKVSLVLRSPLFKITLIRGHLRCNPLQYLNLKYLTRHTNT